MAGGPETVGRPTEWDKAVSAAYLRLIGYTIVNAAKGAGVSERTMQRWVASEWWPDACDEARGRWLRHVDGAARRAISVGLESGDAALGLKVLERLDPNFAPPTQRVAVLNVVQSLPADEVRRLMELAPEERRAALLLLASGDARAE